MDNKSKIWILLARTLSKEASAEEVNELEQRFQEDEKLQQHYEALKKIWNVKNEGNLLPEVYAEKFRFRKILMKAERERNEEKKEEEESAPMRRTWRGRMVKIVACAASVVLGCLIYFLLQEDRKPGLVAEQEVVKVRNGSRTKILLPDGTNVWLNGDSKLWYSKSFSGRVREVILEGEAFFDVVKQAERPFIVHAGPVDIKVLGTAFNVKCYQGDKAIETTLLRGKIEVTEKMHPQKHVFLEPNQKLLVPANSVGVSSPEAPVAAYKVIKLNSKLREEDRIETAWVYNRIEFRGENFEELAKKLERWYNVKIVFEDDRVKGLTFNGSFEKETVEEAFSALQKVAPFIYKIRGNEIFIKSSEQSVP